MYIYIYMYIYTYPQICIHTGGSEKKRRRQVVIIMVPSTETWIQLPLRQGPQYSTKICDTNPKGLDTISNLLRKSSGNLHFSPNLLIFLPTYSHQSPLDSSKIPSARAFPREMSPKTNQK